MTNFGSMIRQHELITDVVTMGVVDVELAQTHREILDELAVKLRVLRESNGLTLKETAKRTGIDLSVISRFETGNRTPSIEQLLVLADAIGSDPAFLLAKPGTRPRKRAS